MANKKTNPLAAGAAGALGGAVIGATAGAILANKKTRQRVAHGLAEIKGYAEDAFSSANSLTGPRVRLAGVKGGASRKISKAKRKFTKAVK